MAAKKDPLIRYTLCAGCNHMWDGFGLPCPDGSDAKTACEEYEKLTKEGESLALEFRDETYIANIHSDGPYLFTFLKLRPLQVGVQLAIDF